MSLTRGTRLGIYEVTAKIGEGEVYQARDTTLDRDVALTVLPEAFTADPDRLARFQREAKVLASPPTMCTSVELQNGFFFRNGLSRRSLIMNRKYLLVLAATWLSLCSATSVVAQQASATSNGPTVRLVDAGAEPRQELRYRFVEGYSEQMAMDMNIGMGLSVGGLQMPVTEMPTIRMLMTIRTTEVAADGTARFEFELASAEVLADATTDPTVASGLEASFGQLGSMSGWARVNVRGNTLEGGIVLPPGADPQLSQIMDSVNQSIQQMSAPLPAEPVGIGARWQISSDMDTGGFQVSQTADYTLTSRQGDIYEMAVNIEQSAEPQVIDMPGMPPGTEANLVSLESTGTGTIGIDLNGLVTRSQVNTETSMELAMAVQGQSQELSMNMSADVTITPVGD